jgi:hypothetical protein
LGQLFCDDQFGRRFENLEQTEQYQGAAQIAPAIYDEVFSGEVDCTDLESAFALFNSSGTPPLHRGHSISVSDVILTDGGAYFCDSIGFEFVEFDSALTHKPENCSAASLSSRANPHTKRKLPTNSAL